jgi:autotransporter-associated beta strand protein
VSGPFSVVIPISGGAAATFTANVHDQNFRTMTAPPVTWSLSPTVAGCSMNSTGQVTLSSEAAGQRFAVTATSGTGTHTFSFSATAPVWTNSAGTGIWNTTDANWSGINWADGGNATFAHTPAAQSITISGNRSADEVKIGNRTNNANYTFTGGSLTADSFTLQGETSTGPTVSETNLASTTVTVAGRADIGRGRLIASGNTILTADTIGSSGTGGMGDWGFLRIQDNAVVTANNGITGNTTAWGLELNGGTLITKSLWAAPWTSAARMIFNGTLIKASADSSAENPSFITLQSNGNNDPPVIDAGGAKFDTNGHVIAIGTALHGSGPLTKSGAGTLTLSGGWNYTGPTHILGGTLASGAAEGISNSLYALTLSDGTLAANNAGSATLGNFQLRGNVTVGGSSTSLISADVRVINNEDCTFTVAPTGDSSGIDLLVSGKLGHHNGSAWGYATKAGDGVMKISGINEIGRLTVNAGKLILENSGVVGMGNGSLVNNTQTELSVTGSNVVSFAQAIQGSGSITKIGSGTLELSAVSSYTGGTVVSEGKLILATGNAAGTGRIRNALTVNANSTVETTGDGTGLGWMDQISSVSLNGGTLTSTGAIHIWNIPGGITMTGGLLQSNNGTSDPNGPQLEWNRTSVITHGSAETATIAGRIRMRNEGSDSGITFAVADGSAATDLLVSAALTEASGGMGITKYGPGTMTLTGTNTYTGQTLINEGTLRVNGSIGGAINVQPNGTLAPGTSIGNLTAPSAAINGTLAIELDGASADRLNVTENLNITNATLALTGTPTGSEVIIASFGSLTGTAFATISGLPSGYEVTYDLTNKQIKLTAMSTGFDAWIGLHSVSDTRPEGDPDHDGIANLMEYVLAGDPSTPSSGILPKADLTSDNLVFTFRRSTSSAGDTIQVFQYGSNLVGWTDLPVIQSEFVSISASITEPGMDEVIITIPTQDLPKMFGRLNVRRP